MARFQQGRRCARAHGDGAFINSRGGFALQISLHQELSTAYAGGRGQCAHFKAAFAAGLFGHRCFDCAFAQIKHRLKRAGAAFAAHLTQFHIGLGLHTHQRAISQTYRYKGIGRNLERVTFLQQLAFLNRAACRRRGFCRVAQ